MGSFYTSHMVRGPSQAEVLAFLRGRPAYVSQSQNGVVTVLDQACESQNGAALSAVASGLSEHFRCAVLAVLNHDDDVLYFELYANGGKTDEYNSAPAYFDDEADDDEPRGGDAARLAAAFGASDVERIEAVLRSAEYVFAFQRHLDLGEALCFPPCSIGIGYRGLAGGDLPPECPEGFFAHTKTLAIDGVVAESAS